MHTTRQTLLGRLILSILPLFIVACTTSVPTQPSTTIIIVEVVKSPEKPTIDSVVPVIIHTDCGKVVHVTAKVDTGADGSSIDKDFANRFCITEPYVADTTNIHCPNGQVYVRGECRKRVILEFSVAGQRIVGRASLSNKKGDRYPLLLGNREMQNYFLVNPVYETTKENWNIDEYELEEEEEE